MNPHRSHPLSAKLRDEIRTRTDLVALARKTTVLRRSGNRYVGLRPFHDEKTPSFHVVPGHGFYHCFGCGAHGDAIEFVMAKEGIGFRATVQRLAEASGLPLANRKIAPGSARQQPGSTAEPNKRHCRSATERATAYRIWCNRQPLAGSIAENYFHTLGTICGDILARLEREAGE